jgi:hypothetical protein
MLLWWASFWAIDKSCSSMTRVMNERRKSWGSLLHLGAPLAGDVIDRMLGNALTGDVAAAIVCG